MEAYGTIYEVTNLDRFIATYLANPNSPDRASFKPIPAARIHIGSVLPKMMSFFPSSSVKTDTDKDGIFALDCSSLSSKYPAHLVAYRLLQVFHMPDLFGKGGGTSIPIFEPIYRSQSFQLSKIDSNPRAIYVIQKELPNEQGISQAQLTKQVNQAKSKIANVDKVSAFIFTDGINVVGEGRGATVTFKIKLSPSTSHDLDRFIKHQIEDFDVDLPGWDWAAGLCVSEDDIENEVSQGIHSIIVSANQQIKQQIINEVAQSAGLNTVLIKELFESRLSLTFNKVRYPVIESKKLGWIDIDLRAIVPDPCLGIPKKLYD